MSTPPPRDSPHLSVLWRDFASGSESRCPRRAWRPGFKALRGPRMDASRHFVLAGSTSGATASRPAAPTTLDSGGRDERRAAIHGAHTTARTALARPRVQAALKETR